MIGTHIPYCKPSIGDSEINEVIDVLRSGWLTMGEKTIEFESNLAGYTGKRYAVAVNSCTAALHLSLLALGIGKGDEVITTPYTFAATANVIVHVGAMPIFVDIDRSTYNIDTEEIEKALTTRTKAIMPVHFAGLPCDMDAVMSIARSYNLAVIEDAAHAIGCRNIGFGNTTCFSFYPTKNMTCGEGGAVVTNDADVANKIKLMRLHGLSADAWKRYGSKHVDYELECCGWKYNPTDIASAIGIEQLKRLNEFISVRRYYASLYDEAFKGRTILPPTDDDHIYHLYPVLVAERDDFITKMAEEGIDCSVHFKPLHLHPYYRHTYNYEKGDYPNAEWVYDHEVSLPLYPAMTEDDVNLVIKAVLDSL